uniref:NADH dehydrogenase subunit 4L n=1 Tax=Romanomermis culicivorax TaxID=13658 RepID=A0A915IU07_ROMCU
MVLCSTVTVLTSAIAKFSLINLPVITMAIFILVVVILLSVNFAMVILTLSQSGISMCAVAKLAYSSSE